MSDPGESRPDTSSKKRDNIDSYERAERAVFLPDPEDGRPNVDSKKSNRLI